MRNRCVFELARYLKGFYEDHDVQDMHAFVLEWFTRYQNNIRTKDFDVTWIDFVNTRNTLTSDLLRIG